jgi:ABC-type amino acid transport substrate-binding protein
MLRTKYQPHTRHVVQAIALALLIFLPCKAAAMNNDTIIIVCNEMSAPYSFSKGGVPVGLHISLAQEAMKRIGRPYKIVLTSWNNCISMLLNRKADIIFGLRRRESLEGRGIIFGTKLSDDYEVAIYKDESNEPDNLSDLRKMKVLVGRSSYEDELLNTEVPAIPHDVTERADTAFLQVANGKYDVTMTSFQVASDIISYQKLYNLKISDKLQISSPYYIAGTNQQLLSIFNMEIESMHRDGTYKKLHSRWIPLISDRMSNTIVLILCFLVASCVLAYLLALWLNRKAKRAMRALKEKEKEISIAMRTGDLDVWTYDVKTRRLHDIEQAFFPKGGMNIEEFKENIVTEDWEHLQTIYKKCINEHSDSFTYSTRLRLEQDGSLLYIENKAYIERDEHDEITRVIGSCRNVTEWHKMEQKLQENAERMHLAIKTSKMLLWEINSDTLMVSFENLITNTHRRDFSLPEIRNLVHPLDIKDFDKVIDIIKNHENKNFETNIRFYNNDGKRYLYFTLNGQPYHKLNGDIKSYVGFARNNTNIVDLNNELKDYAMKISYVLDTGGINTWEYNVTERDIKMFGKDKSVIVQYSEEEYMEMLSDRCRKRILGFFEKMHDALFMI